jgi:trehalose 6-phosphate phosphatase
MRGARAPLQPGNGPPVDRLERWALFLDLDGTVLDIADSPEGVHVDPALRELVGRLFRRLDGAVALISGRRVGDIDRLFPRLRLPVAGVHGAVRRDARGVLHRHAAELRIAGHMRNRLLEAVNGRAGLILEDKGVSLALHYRRAPRLAGFAHRLVGELVAQARGRFKLQPGKRVVEIKPAGRDKGTAIAEYMREAPFRERLPVFLGDDATDEYGFTVVNRLGGLSVKVGPGPTRARWRLRNVAAVRAWLARGLDGASRRRRAR